MALLPKYPPTFDRSGSTVSRTSHSGLTAYPQPYLVAAKHLRPGKHERFLPLFPHESEDARLTGSTRSLYRRVLGLNVMATVTRLEIFSSFDSSKIA